MVWAADKVPWYVTGIIFIFLNIVSPAGDMLRFIFTGKSKKARWPEKTKNER